MTEPGGAKRFRGVDGGFDPCPPTGHTSLLASLGCLDRTRSARGQQSLQYSSVSDEIQGDGMPISFPRLSWSD